MIIDNFRDLKQALERNTQRDEARAANTQQQQPLPLYTGPASSPFVCPFCRDRRTVSSPTGRVPCPQCSRNPQP
jgi:hypothetical protein